MNLSEDIVQSIANDIAERVVSSSYVTSGAANDIFRIVTANDKSFIVKVCKTSLTDVFRCEADALNHLASTHTVMTPKVIIQRNAYLIMQDMGTPSEQTSNADWERFGRQVGQMHCVHSEAFGYTGDNYIGQWVQTNTPTRNWAEFFWNCRVACYLDAGKNKEILTTADRDGMRHIVETLSDSIPDQEPSLCHGDLWIDNAFRSAGGEIYLIDPAIHFGLPEADLVMTDMYGGFPDAFYAGYRETHELLPDWKDRTPLYQLKEILLMVAQFGDEKSLANLRSSIAKYR
jgi:fructosamine-3-kinase